MMAPSHMIKNVAMIFLLMTKYSTASALATGFNAVKSHSSSLSNNDKHLGLKTVHLNASTGQSKLSGLQEHFAEQSNSKKDTAEHGRLQGTNAIQHHSGSAKLSTRLAKTSGVRSDFRSSPPAVHPDDPSRHVTSGGRISLQTRRPSDKSATVRIPAAYSNGSRPAGNNTAGLSGRIVGIAVVSAVHLPDSNASAADRGTNSTALNDSRALVAGGGQPRIELVFIQRPRAGEEQASTPDGRLAAAVAGPSRRFPSAILPGQNVTLIHSNVFRHLHAAHEYWPVYLTMTLMCLCVVGICVVCCTSQGRRNMSVPAKSCDQELPPYNYPFSYDMRTAENLHTGPN